MFFLYIKIDFWHGRSGMADRERSWLSYPITFLHDRLKKQRWLLSAGVFRLPQNNKSVSVKIMTGLSLSILSA